MYKVYFNHNVIEFTNNAPNEAPLVFNKMLLKQLGLNIVKTLKPNENVHIYIVDKDIDSCFSLFRSMFDLIDAAGGLVHSPHEDLLLIYRNGIWDLPKGKVEAGEGLQEAAVREVSEECGIPQEALKVDGFLDYSYHIYPLEQKWMFKTTAWYVMQTNEEQALTPQQEEGITELKWVPLDNLKDYVNKAYPLIIDMIMRYLKMNK